MNNRDLIMAGLKKLLESAIWATKSVDSLDENLNSSINFLVFDPEGPTLLSVDEESLYKNVNIAPMARAIDEIIRREQKAPSSGSMDSWQVSCDFNRNQVREDLEAELNRIRTPSNRVVFCSEPRVVREFLVCTVIEVDLVRFEAVPQSPLSDEENNRNRFLAETIGHHVESLLDGLIKEIFSRCAFALRHLAINSQSGDLNLGGVIRDAAGQLVHRAYRVSVADADFGLTLFDRMCRVSEWTYETSSVRGAILITERCPSQISFIKPVDLEKTRFIRKLLELSREGGR